MPLSMEVGLGPGHIVRWEPSSPKKGGGTAPIFDPCPLWPNGQTAGWIKIPLAMEVDLGLGDIVFDVDPATPRKKGNWTLRLRDISPTTHFAYDMDSSPNGQFAY